MKSLINLIEAAMSRRRYIAAIDGVSQQVFNHIMKLHMYPNARDENHWKKEIAALLSRLFVKLKSNDSYKSRKSIIYDYLIEQPYDSFDDHSRMTNLIDTVDGWEYDYTAELSSNDIWLQNRQHIIDLYEKMIDSIARNDAYMLKKLLTAYTVK